MAALQQAHGRDHGEEPGEFADLGHIRLHPEGAALRIETEGEEVGGRLERALAQPVPVLDRGEGVQVDDEHVQLGTFHVRQHGLHHAEIVTDVEFSRGLDARQYAFHGTSLGKMMEEKGWTAAL